MIRPPDDIIIKSNILQLFFTNASQKLINKVLMTDHNIKLMCFTCC